MADGEADGWVLDEAARQRVAAALAEIDKAQERFPQCRACGQRTSSRTGFCSKKTAEHDRLVAEAGWARR